MFLYYLRLAMISIRRNPILSGLMVAAIGMGIGAFMTIVTLNYSMSGNPIPEKSDALFAVQLDSWDPNKAFEEPNYPPTQLTYLDAMALMKAKRAVRQTANSGAALVIEAQGGEAKPFSVRGRANFSDFFPMFNVPFIYGAGWDTGADDAGEQVVVVSREINDRVFGGENSVGRTLRMSGHDFRVTGVIDNWSPVPKFYDLTTGAFNQTEEVFVPFNLIAKLELTRSGNNNCWKMPDDAGLQAYLNSECVWIQYWAELRSEDAKADYLAFLDSYVGEQKLLGRFPRPLNNDLHNVVEWIEYMEVVPDEARFLLAVASMFLLVCLLNTLGLLLAKFVGKAPEIGLRRALGASKRTLFIQHLVEASCIGVAGGLLGLALAWAGLRGIDALLAGLAARLVEMDWVMVTAAVFMALLSSLVAGLYPTWRACNVAPAAQLKSS